MDKDSVCLQVDLGSCKDCHLSWKAYVSARRHEIEGFEIAAHCYRVCWNWDYRSIFRWSDLCCVGTSGGIQAITTLLAGIFMVRWDEMERSKTLLWYFVRCVLGWDWIMASKSRLANRRRRREKKGDPYLIFSSYWTSERFTLLNWSYLCTKAEGDHGRRLIGSLRLPS